MQRAKAPAMEIGRAQGDRGELGGHATNALDGVQQRALPR